MQDIFNLRNERSLSHQRHPAAAGVDLQLRVAHRHWQSGRRRLGQALERAAGGWQVSGFMTFQSGVPLDISQSGGTLWAGTQRPDLVGDPNPGGSVVQRLDAYFNPAAFLRPVPDTLGTAPRTLNYRAPGIRNAEMALLKSFLIREQMRGEFRFELQNATNTPSFGFPATGFGSVNFGTITGYKSGLGARQAQLGLKFYF